MRLRRLAAACGVVALLGATQALAAQQPVVASVRDQYSVANVTIDQGQTANFQNLDVDQHNVVAEAKGSDGQPLFASALIGTSQTVPVDGTQYLTTGSYPFICTIHTFMHGTINVSANGTPVPRPGGAPNPTPSSGTPGSGSRPGQGGTPGATGGGGSGSPGAKKHRRKKSRKRCAGKRHRKSCRRKA